MEVIYNKRPIHNDEFLKVIETQKQPEIKLDVDITKTYLLILYDPDAVVGTFIHWILTDIKNNNADSGKNLIKYKGPAPPYKSGKHHYIFELYEQKISNINQIKNRVMSIEDLRNKLELDNPIHKIQFISQNQNGGNKKIKTIKRNKNKKRKTKRKI
jgi:phosphatidylethanolamine-binding protein (PEBP) family uncharacterized protein